MAIVKKHTDADIKDLEENNIDFLARLTCLIYGVNVAADAAEKMGIDTTQNSDWIKPIVFQKYIDERFEDMKFNIVKSLDKNNDEVYSW
jgi:hypothetical protein